MKLLLRANVPMLGTIGEVVTVKAGYARNYLVPYGLGVEPTPANLKRIEEEKKAYLAGLAERKAEIRARAALVDGKEITLSCRANEQGHLYGSVGPAQIVEALAADGVHIEEGNILLDEPIRTLDKYEVKLGFGEEVTASIDVWVVPIREEEDEDSPAGVAGADAPAEESAQE